MESLVPFDRNELCRAQLRLLADACRENGKLHLSYEVQGELDRIRWPLPVSAPQRQNELWKRTCMEAFIQPEGESGYWEINLSPSGDWNFYRFEAYRSAMMEEPRGALMDLKAERLGKSWKLTASLDISSIEVLKSQRPIRIGLTAVIEDDPGAITYWALKHAGTQPDFHLGGSFTLLR